MLPPLHPQPSSKRKVVVIVRERGGNSVPAVFSSESRAAAFIKARIAKGTTVHADEAHAWDNLHKRFEVKRINHQEAYPQNVHSAPVERARDRSTIYLDVLPLFTSGRVRLVDNRRLTTQFASLERRTSSIGKDR